MRRTLFVGTAMAGVLALIGAVGGAASETTTGSATGALDEVALCASNEAAEADADVNEIHAAVEQARAEIEALAENPEVARLKAANDELLAQEGLDGAAREACDEIEAADQANDQPETELSRTDVSSSEEQIEPAENENDRAVEAPKIEVHSSPEPAESPEQEYSGDGGSHDGGSESGSSD